MNALRIAKDLAYDLNLRWTYRVRWFEEWNPALDAALGALPEMDGCSHELFQMLATNPRPAIKRIALVNDGDAPVAVVALRKRTEDWVPVTHYIVPGSLLPAREGCLPAVAAVLGVNLRLALWRYPTPLPDFEDVRTMESIPTYKMRCGDDIEGYWRKQQHLNEVKRMRKRCERFQIKVNHPGALEWVIAKWDEKWREPASGDREDLRDRLVAAQYLEKHNLSHTFVILDAGRLIAGSTVLVHRNALVGQYSYRDPDFDWYGVGHRLMDFIFEWASKCGYAEFDLGGAYPDYKRRWGPQDGEKWHIQIRPELSYRMRQLRELAGSFVSKVGSLGRTRSAPCQMEPAGGG